MWSLNRIVSPVAVGLGAVLGLGAGGPAGAATIKVMTYNTDHGGLRHTPPTTDAQLDTIAAQHPDVVVLQEADGAQLGSYVNGLNAREGTTAWHGAYALHCDSGRARRCMRFSGEAVMILTRLTTSSTDATLIWARDDYFVARATVHMRVLLRDGTAVNVFACHLPAHDNAQRARVRYVTAFQAWAQSFGEPRLVGGDFNDSPGMPPIVAMAQQYTDAWATGGTGPGFTHAQGTVEARIDYWFGDIKGAETVGSVHLAGSVVNSDHLALVVTYHMPTTTETTLLDDPFRTFVSANWRNGLYTGRQDSTIPITVNGRLQIGDLKTAAGSHFNGVSSRPYDLSNNGSASVQLVTPPNTGTTADAMFAVGSNRNNFYRWYESGNALVVQKKVAGTKTTLLNLPYDAVAHQFLRIRREYDAASGFDHVVFETAPAIAGGPGVFTARYRDVWDAYIVAAALRFELKAGTSDPVVSPGTATWSNFHAASNSR